MTDSRPVVLFFSGDLIFASRVRGAAEMAGCEFKLAGRWPEPTPPHVRAAVLDLATKSKSIDAIVEAWRTHAPDSPLIAYGPHVQVEALRAARAAGVPTVLTRGQFDAALATLFEEVNVAEVAKTFGVDRLEETESRRLPLRPDDVEPAVPAHQHRVQPEARQAKANGTDQPGAEGL